MTPSKPLSRARPACAQSSSAMAPAGSSLCGYSRMETDPAAKGADGRVDGDGSVIPTFLADGLRPAVEQRVQGGGGPFGHLATRRRDLRPGPPEKNRWTTTPVG